MIVYRLVDKAHDNIAPGETLSRTSDKSKQKLGDGVYFALDRGSALDFAHKDHGYTYTHLLKCEVPGRSVSDFADLISDPSLITCWASGRWGLREAVPLYCKANKLFGAIWQATDGWKELVLLKEFAVGTVRIVESEKLVELNASGGTVDAPDDQPGSLDGCK